LSLLQKDLQYQYILQNDYGFASMWAGARLAPPVSMTGQALRQFGCEHSGVALLRAHT
jgi:hypothetical protein